MNYDKLKSINSDYKIPHFAMCWLRISNGMSSSEIQSMELSELAKLGKSGIQAISELNNSIPDSDTEIKKMLRDILVTIPILNRVTVHDKE